MKIVVVIARILLGLPFVVFGADWFFHFMEPVGNLSPGAQAWVDAMQATGYAT